MDYAVRAETLLSPEYGWRGSQHVKREIKNRTIFCDKKSFFLITAVLFYSDVFVNSFDIGSGVEWNFLMNSTFQSGNLFVWGFSLLNIFAGISTTRMNGIFLVRRTVRILSCRQKHVSTVNYINHTIYCFFMGNHVSLNKLTSGINNWRSRWKHHNMYFATNNDKSWNFYESNKLRICHI